MLIGEVPVIKTQGPALSMNVLILQSDVFSTLVVIYMLHLCLPDVQKWVAGAQLCIFSLPSN